MAYTFLNNRPSQITQYAEPVTFDERLKVNLGIYVQDQWTLRRLTLNLGLRYDYFNAYVPEQSLPPGRSCRRAATTRSNACRAGRTSAREWRWPTIVFGNGRTALKVNLGRYVAADIYTQARANNPVTRAVLNASRTWTDSNNNFAPDCDLANPNAQNLSESGGDVCGALNNVNFGKNNPNATTYAPRYADRIRGPLAQLADADHVRSAAAPQHLTGRRLLPDRVQRLLRHPERRGEPGAGRLQRRTA